MIGGRPKTRVRALLIGPLKVNKRPLFIHLYYTKFSILAIFYKDNARPGYLCYLLGVITFHLSCYSEIKGKRNDYWSEYDQ